ncbi:hypothetical protein [Egicoccus sp. AB-alg6-2]|uniref:hypothetical protein n=1 Tax=Egicoccus sp. AB-alg6-2 TaxID=3242692 RepID=UPI00359DB868
MTQHAVDIVWEFSPYGGERLLFHLAFAKHAVLDDADPGFHEQVLESALPDIAQDARMTADAAAGHLAQLLQDGIVYPADGSGADDDRETTVYALNPLPLPD